ncbi:peptidoglycan-binding domain-containing protein [Salininema proteolyticum]|uniref:Peptidoglycan-binding protein n=1 Tax=Salininema proteolyticum TaxID=1607685 RepID=A0ABV8TVF3_9ACTN
MRRAIRRTTMVLATLATATVMSFAATPAGAAPTGTGSAEPVQNNIAAAASAGCNTATKVNRTNGTLNLPTYNGNATCVMGQGSQGAAVKVLQATLYRCYGAGISIDGVFGPNTATALKRAQEKMRIPADGVYGPQTRDALVWLFLSPSGACRTL